MKKSKYLVCQELVSDTTQCESQYESVSEPIHVVNVSLNVSLNDDHQMLKYQSFDPFMLQIQPYL